MNILQGQLFDTTDVSKNDVASLSILGISGSGEAAARLAVAVGVQNILLSDANPKATLKDDLLTAPTMIQTEVGSHEQLLHHSETVVLSPGVPPHADIIQQLRSKHFTLLSEPDWAKRNAPDNALGWIAITGTNGKSTVTSLIAHMLNSLEFLAPSPFEKERASRESDAGEDVYSSSHPHPNPLLPKRRGGEFKALACGNIGLAVSDVMVDAIKHPETLYQPVVELSSYQLHYSQDPLAEMGVFTNLTPDHLSWHGGISEYTDAKAKLFVGDTSAKQAVINLDDPVGMHMAMQRNAEQCIGIHSKRTPLKQLHIPQLFINQDDYVEAFIPATLKMLPFFRALRVLHLSRSVFPFEGPHHTQNFLLSLGAVIFNTWSLAHSLKALKDPHLSNAYQSFHAMPHRFERVPMPDNRVVINDSKATNAEASIAALSCFERGSHVILLVGGRSKKTPLDQWAKMVKERCLHVFCFGEDADEFYEALAGGFPLPSPPPKGEGVKPQIKRIESMEEATREALALQDEHPDWPILLAPASASQDAFDNFEHRGQVFKDVVRFYIT